MRSAIKAIVAGGFAAGLLFAMAGNAAAEPPPTPGVLDYTSVGSDTLQGLENAIQADWNATSPAHKYVSWNATGGGSIVPKGTGTSACASITRPNGSGSGITNLAANAVTGAGDAGAHYCINIARSSRGPQAGDPTGLTWLNLAKDDVSWAADASGNAPSNLTRAQLANIFACTPGYTHWNDPAIGGTSSDTIYPVLPQPGSGTRSFWLSALGVAAGSCVDTTTNPEENEGTNAIFTGAHKANVIFPYSGAVYAAQHFNSHGAGDEGTLTIRDIDGQSPVNASGTPRTINPNFTTPTPAADKNKFLRIVYKVIRTTALNTTGTKDGSVYADLAAPYNISTHTGGYECQYSTSAPFPTPEQELLSYGFASLGAQCGAVAAQT
ncbi:hypothetical protein AB0M46_13930 [Dactylosporangium sp. NPDC051485]|uniref:hypothetical protein n=1 Tax=Dactylosporangium sp. NPDC051485 TaxID=3154846 RepID=UPI0034143D79